MKISRPRPLNTVGLESKFKSSRPSDSHPCNSRDSEAEAKGCHDGLHSDVQANLSYSVRLCLKEQRSRAGAMALQVKALATKPDSLNLIPKTHM